MEGKNIHSDAIKSNIIQIMLIRKMAILSGDMTELEVDTIIDETGREWADKTENMVIGEVMMEMMMQTVKRKIEVEATEKQLKENM